MILLSGVLITDLLKQGEVDEHHLISDKMGAVGLGELSC